MAIKPGKPAAATLKDEAALRDHALQFPNVTEDRPWGHRAFKINGKTFLFLSASVEGLSLSTKLRDSHAEALALPFTEPTHYGLGKSGWVSAKFAPGEKAPLSTLRGFIDESFRLIAPKRLVASMTGEAASEAPKRKKSKNAAPAAGHRDGATRAKKAARASTKARARAR